MNGMNQPIRWGILGTGQIARTFAAALRDVPDAVLHAVASRTLETAQVFAGEFGAAQCHGDYQSLANDDAIDVIYIATPHTFHAENALMCLHAGKPVLCEKPFTMNARQARQVIAVAREKNLFLMEAMWTRFLPALQEAKRLIAAGEIGRPHHVQADLGFAAEVGPTHRLRNPDLGGGGLMDIGIYPLSIAAFFLGDIASVHAIAELGETGVDEQTAFSLRHRQGGLSSCICSTRANSPIELMVAGERGYLRLHTPFFRADAITVHVQNEESRTIAMPYRGNGYTHEAMEVMRCLRAGLTESPVMPLDETLALMACMDDMRQQFGLRYAEDAPVTAS